jgi:hypothetical protein
VRGEERHFAVTAKLDAAWFTKFFALLEGYQTGDYFQASIADESMREAKQEYRSFATFRVELLGRLDSATRVNCWITSGRSHLDCDLDLRRGSLRLKLEARTIDDVRESFQKFSDTLSLRPSDANPYQYRRHARSYTIDEWTSNEAFATALETLVKEVYLTPFGRKPAVANLFAIAGKKVEDLHSFDNDLNKFVAWLPKQGADFRQARIYLEGPQGIAIGINVDRTCKKFEIRSSLTRAAFNDAAQIFANAINLKDPQDIQTKQPDEKDGRAFWLENLFIPALLAQLSQLRHVETENPLFFNGSSQKVCTTFARLFLQ